MKNIYLISGKFTKYFENIPKNTSPLGERFRGRLKSFSPLERDLV